MNDKTKKPRGRDLGLPFPGETGAHNAITDVPGVEVGYSTITRKKDDRDEGSGVQTGVTAILPRGRAAPLSYVFAGLHSFNGNGEMTGSHWIRDAGYFCSPICITNTHSVGMVHHGVLKWMLENHPDFARGKPRFVMPVVAETYDGFLSDINGLHVGEKHVFAALNGAHGGPIAEGNVGGGNGMLTYEFKGGTGTSSRKVDIGAETFTLGALVQSNFGSRRDLTVCGAPVGEHYPEDTILDQVREKEFGSIIVVIATDAPFLPSQLDRIARRATLGLARTGTTGGHGSGDIFLAFSTGNDAVDISQKSTLRNVKALDEMHLDSFYRAARDATEEAIINAMLAAETSHSLQPEGLVARAIDHEKLIKIVRNYNRIV